MTSAFRQISIAMSDRKPGRSNARFTGQRKRKAVGSERETNGNETQMLKLINNVKFPPAPRGAYAASIARDCIVGHSMNCDDSLSVPEILSWLRPNLNEHGIVRYRVPVFANNDCYSARDSVNVSTLTLVKQDQYCSVRHCFYFSHIMLHLQAAFS